VSTHAPIARRVRFPYVASCGKSAGRCAARSATVPVCCNDVTVTRLMSYFQGMESAPAMCACDAAGNENSRQAETVPWRIFPSLRARPPQRAPLSDSRKRLAGFWLTRLAYRTNQYGLMSAYLRYFNAIGTSQDRIAEAVRARIARSRPAMTDVAFTRAVKVTPGGSLRPQPGSQWVVSHGNISAARFGIRLA
jgi:hypothetical protein